MKTRAYVSMVCALAGLAAAERAARADTLQDYAAQCDAAVGATVPDFDCDAGTLVPTTNHANGKCDRPNVLVGECDPGSRFQVLKRTTDVEIVAHCRKQGNSGSLYKDIAVIQYNKTNGATCFYQNTLVAVDGRTVKAPSKGLDAWSWLPPLQTASIQCASCHDNGPIIRSPYLAQLRSGSNSLPGAGDLAYNRNQPYRLIGTDFAPWKMFKVEVSDATCTSCHRMAVNTRSGERTDKGAALALGLLATASSQAAKNPHSATSPIWMLPGQNTYDPAIEQKAKQIRDCAQRVTETPLPSGTDCRITAFSTASDPPPLLPPILPPVDSAYEQASRIHSAYQGLFKRRPSDAEYLRALKFLLRGGLPGQLPRIMYPPNDILLTGVAGWTTLPLATSLADGTFFVFNSDVGSFGNWASSPGAKKIVGDFNADGVTDIALTGGQGWLSIPVARSLINGSFAVTAAGLADFPDWAAAAGVDAVGGDFDGDGSTDIALLGGAGWTTVPVAFSNRDGSFRVTNKTAQTFAGMARLNPGAARIVGDFNRDGRDDLALIINGSLSVPLALSQADGSFKQMNSQVGTAFRDATNGSAAKKVTGDFDGDGTTDIAIVGGPADTIVVAFGKGDGTWRVTSAAVSTFPALAREAGATALVGDFDRDGRADIALVGATGRTTIPVAFSKGDGTFSATNAAVTDVPALASGQPGASRLIGDFNHDGRADIAVVGGAGWTDIHVAISIGDGTFRTERSPVGAFGSWASSAGVSRHMGDYR